MLQTGWLTLGVVIVFAFVLAGWSVYLVRQDNAEYRKHRAIQNRWQ